MSAGENKRIQVAYTAFLLTTAFLALAPAAFAGDALSDLYGNTLISVDGGIESHFWYKPDHTFTGTVPAFYFALRGTWSENTDGTICRVFDPPLPTVKNPDCGPVLVHKVGDAETAPHGDSERLVAGVK